MKAQGTRPIFSVQLDEDASAGCIIIRVRRVKKLPPTWSLLAGDAIFNFRASLDYLAWQLVQVGTQPKPEKPEMVMWPVIRKQADADATINLRLPGILPKHRALVEAFQPYQGEPGRVNPLVVLNDLSRHDKHRKITVISAKHKDYEVSGTVKHFVRERDETPSPDAPLMLEPGAELLRIFGQRTGDGEPEVVKVRLKGTTGIAFENGLWVLEVLDRVENLVGNILANFERLF